MADGSLARVMFAREQDEVGIYLASKYGAYYEDSVLQEAIAAAQAAMSRDHNPDQNSEAAKAAAKEVLDRSPRKKK